MRQSLFLILLLCACGDVGLGVPGSGTPLPAGGLPPAQTLEGGAQIRVSQAGFTKLTSIVPGIVSDALSQGLCVPSQSAGGTDLCFTNQGGCTPGCFFDLDLNPNGLGITVTNANTVNVQIRASAVGFVRIDPPIFSACTVSLTIDELTTDADIRISIDPATGAFSAGIDRINTSSPSGVNYSGCSVVTDLASLMTDFVDSLLGYWILDAVTPALNTVIGAFVPTQTELAALVDLPGLALTGLAASNGSAVETRVVPGSYVQLGGGGMSLGIITGFNSDADPETRSAGLVSEPDPCVAGLVAPDLSLPPFALPITSRETFALPPADTFLGFPDPADDLRIGVSQSALDLAGHHMVASGGMCLTLDSDQAVFVRRDMLDDLLGVPLAAADAELRFVVRPQQPIRFSVGTGTDLSPHLSAAFDDLEIDVESLPSGTATPALTLIADVAIGSQLGTRRDAGLAMRLETTRSALSIANPAVQVFDARYAAVAAADLAGLAGTIVDVVFSTLGADAGTVLVSSFAGFSLANVVVARVTTTSDDFLAVTASLGAVAGTPPPILDPPAPTPQPLSIALVLPSPAELRAALLAGDGAGLPTLHVELPTTDGARPLEHAWRTAGGAWRPYEVTGDLVIRDRSFAWQGERTIELRSRVVGDDGTTSPVGSFVTVIDWAPPTIFAEQASFATHLVVPARDALSPALEWAMGRIDESEPATQWTSDANLDAASALSLGDSVVVYVRDDVGNVARSPAIQLVPEPGAVAAGGLACAALAFLARLGARPQAAAARRSSSMS